MKSSMKIALSTSILFGVVGLSVGLALGLAKNKPDSTVFMATRDVPANKYYEEEVSEGPSIPFVVYQTTTNTSGINYIKNITSVIPNSPASKTNTTGTRVPIWWDEFDGTEINQGSWVVANGGDQSGWGNAELQTYHESNIEVRNGSLYIVAKNENGGWTSGRVMTKGAWYPGMEIPYGITTKIYLEAKITVPESGMGIWPAFWAFPQDSEYGSFSQSGEIDIMELRRDYANLTQGIHYGGEHPKNKKTMIRVGDVEPEFTLANKTFVFSTEWSKNSIVFFWNGVETGRMVPRSVDQNYGWYSDADVDNTDAPFDKPFYAIFNIAIGGKYPGEPDENTPPVVTMAVDYFRVYADYIDVSS